MARTSTPDRINADGSTTIRVQRCCNGCGRRLGDATETELNTAITRGSLPDVREECGCIKSTVQLGQTCTVGNGKTRWEIIRIEANGTLHLSKVGADGYTNRWAEPADLRNIQHRTMDNTLGDVLTKRQEAADAAKLLADQITRHAKPAALVKLQDDVVVKTRRYTRTYAGHLAELEAAQA